MSDYANEKAEQQARKMTEFKAACGGELVPRYSQMNVDGSRLHVVDLPVHPNFNREKGGYEIMILWCREGKGDEMKPVKCEVGYRYGGMCGMGTYYRVKHAASDQAAIWEAGCCLYHEGMRPHSTHIPST
jgi:hypothetical protein